MEESILDETVLRTVILDLQSKNGGSPVLVRLVKRKYEEVRGPYRGSFLRYFREQGDEKFKLISGRAKGFDLVCSTDIGSVSSVPRKKTKTPTSPTKRIVSSPTKKFLSSFIDDEISLTKLQQKVRELTFNLKVKDQKLEEYGIQIKDLKAQLLVKDRRIQDLEQQINEYV